MRHWYDESIMPPDELVEVKDEQGHTAEAYPCIYTFRFENPTRLKWGSKVVTCAPYQEGWLVDCSDFNFNKIGRIIAWRPIHQMV